MTVIIDMENVGSDILWGPGESNKLFIISNYL